MPGDHVTENRRHWDADAPNWAAAGERLWAGDPRWGQWGVPEDELQMLPASMEGIDAIELGCGTGYVSGWMWRRGATVTGVDVSERQLETARRLSARHGSDVDFLMADAEDVPRAGASHDFAVSEYGAALWCEPRAWLAEAHRLLRPGGRLVFLSAAPLVTVCSPLDGSYPIGTEMIRPYFGQYRVDWSEVEVEPGGVEFVPTISEWFRIFRETGFTIDDYVEVQVPVEATGTEGVVDADWARRWPAEHVWKLTRATA